MRIIFYVYLSLMVPITALANSSSYIGLTLENDMYVHEDGGYSNGLFIDWGYDNLTALDHKVLPDWLAYLAFKTPINDLKERKYRINYSIGQAIQTAIDLETHKLVEEDAPYVGLLGWNVNVASYSDLNMDEFGLILGAVGPVAGGEFVQSFVHDLTGGKKPQGWDNQINNEFVFRVQLRRTWRVYDMPISIGEFDLLTGIDGGLGNLRSDIATGIGFRFGQQLTHNFSSSTVFPIQKFNRFRPSPFGWYLFANASASYVANDIFIDGNTFQDSHSVDLIHPQFTFSAGLVANLYDISLLFTLVNSSDEYEGQTESSRFGSISLAYHF
ncbi:hypothetical protein CW745_04565 [Psychromonas sp. psych-6C06]|uniref:lipid A deacylase LpxR family protein n=1 Tax=Psychromonas sp. psych-6C06 TaxID=2058089 RepID=UPI000C33595C|nr:lipid A deacylase LpxR family protein [Psychromonas sp. psych-6C06]PKF62698.1 hypothetical protein CW745_04565 [Psychromonas sp. psych-6C06]